MTIYNKWIYRVDRIDFKKSPLDSFTNEKGEEEPFEKYYSEKYNITIK